ncbi:MAG: hypothetical protein WC838_00410 [Candidatus Margulisiibacteriota bacterium]|jgi:hypothetical protein
MLKKIITYKSQSDTGVDAGREVEVKLAIEMFQYPHRWYPEDRQRGGEKIKALGPEAVTALLRALSRGNAQLSVYPETLIPRSCADDALNRTYLNLLTEILSNKDYPLNLRTSAAVLIGRTMFPEAVTVLIAELKADYGNVLVFKAIMNALVNLGDTSSAELKKLSVSFAGYSWQLAEIVKAIEMIDGSAVENSLKGQ